jgi:hypothetical protein
VPKAAIAMAPRDRRRGGGDAADVVGVAVGDRVGQVDDERAELRAQPQAARSEEHDEQGLGMAPGEQARAQRDIRAGQEQAAGGRCERPQARRQPPHDLARGAERRHPRDEREPGLERAATEPLLEIEREREEQPVVRAGGGRDGEHARRDGPRGERVEAHERRAARVRTRRSAATKPAKAGALAARLSHVHAASLGATTTGTTREHRGRQRGDRDVDRRSARATASSTGDGGRRPR